jgi:hypothetical protein
MRCECHLKLACYIPVDYYEYYCIPATRCCCQLRGIVCACFVSFRAWPTTNASRGPAFGARDLPTRKASRRPPPVFAYLDGVCLQSARFVLLCGAGRRTHKHIHTPNNIYTHTHTLKSPAYSANRFACFRQVLSHTRTHKHSLTDT